MENRRSLQKEHRASKITRTSLNYAVCLIVIRNEMLGLRPSFFFFTLLISALISAF